MTCEVVQNDPINITPMSAQEARECVAAIKGNLESLRLMLLKLRRRRGWEVLGYASWEDCARAEFGKSRSYVFQLVAAAEVEENLASQVESTIVDWQNLPISHLTALAKLPPEKQADALLKAEEIAQAKGKKRNAIHVIQAVKAIQPGEPAKNQTGEYIPTTATDWATDAEPGSTVAPTDLAPGLTTAQMLSAAVEACLGDVTIPESLDEPLQGVVYVSPKQASEQWVSKLLQAFKDRAVTEAIALLPLEHQVFVKLADYPLCPLDGFVAVYLGTRLDNFVLCFEDLGVVWHRYK
jgi:hypothetical protein